MATIASKEVKKIHLSIADLPLIPLHLATLVIHPSVH